MAKIISHMYLIEEDRYAARTDHPEIKTLIFSGTGAIYAINGEIPTAEQVTLVRAMTTEAISTHQVITDDGTMTGKSLDGQETQSKLFVIKVNHAYPKGIAMLIYKNAHQKP